MCLNHTPPVLRHRIEPPRLISCRDDGGKLYLGGIDAILSGDAIQYDCIVSVIESRHLTRYRNECINNDLVRHYSVEDEPTFPILNVLDDAIDYVSDSLSNGKSVYVHCFMGVSRSATIVVAYLMKYHGMSLNAAVAHVRSKRNILINHGFMDQLKRWESL